MTFLYNFSDTFKSGFRSIHSTENVLLQTLDTSSHTVLFLLDLSDAFDTINHSILLYRLRVVGIQGVALQWLTSYLKDRTFSVDMGMSSLSSVPLLCGVP